MINPIYANDTDRLAPLRDRELCDLINGLYQAFDLLNRRDALRRGRLTEAQVAALAAIGAAIRFLNELRYRGDAA
jgi:hypothetical protein